MESGGLWTISEVEVRYDRLLAGVLADDLRYIGALPTLATLSLL